MIGVNITTKDGLLIFSHFFISGFSDVDEDLRAGLMTAVLNAVKETNDDTGIVTVDQGKYFVHIVEGDFTYGLFFSQENDIKENTFANTILKRFEKEFHEKLVEEISFDNSEFANFVGHLKREYSALLSIDVVGLSKIIELMKNSVFTDYIILELPYLNQVFTTISNPHIHPHANQLALMCKNMIGSSFKLGLEINNLQFNLGENFFAVTERLKKYYLIVIMYNKERDKILKILSRIHNKLKNIL